MVGAVFPIRAAQRAYKRLPNSLSHLRCNKRSAYIPTPPPPQGVEEEAPFRDTGMGPEGTAARNNCAGEDQQQFVT